MLVIGIGNEFRSDDVIGLIIAREVKKQANVRVIESSGEGSALLNLWENESQVILIDAIKGNGEYGRIYQIDIHKEELPGDFAPCTTHAFGLREAIEMAKTLGQLPPCFTVYGIEGKCFHHGTEISQMVQKSIPLVVEKIIRDIENYNNKFGKR